jgi:hypothetical protein
MDVYRVCFYTGFTSHLPDGLPQDTPPSLFVSLRLNWLPHDTLSSLEASQRFTPLSTARAILAKVMTIKIGMRKCHKGTTYFKK